jgi:hypothetical protein
MAKDYSKAARVEIPQNMNILQLAAVYQILCSILLLAASRWELNS